MVATSDGPLSGSCEFAQAGFPFNDSGFGADSIVWTGAKFGCVNWTKATGENNKE